MNRDAVVLLPCPFCGSGAFLDFAGPEDVRKWEVSCIECGINTGWKGSEKSATALWNTRAAISAMGEASVKPLVWDQSGTQFAKAKAPLFGSILIENYGASFHVTWSVPGYCDTFAEGSFGTMDAAKAAAQADYETRIISALSAPVSGWRNIESAKVGANFFDSTMTANDRVAAYFEHITGRPMTREEKIPLGGVIAGDCPDIPDTWTAPTQEEGE